MDKLDITEGIMKAGALVGGFLGGVLAAMFRRPRVNGRPSPVGMIAIESEVSQIVRKLRHDMDQGFSDKDEEMRVLVRRIRKHDDDIDGLKTRLSLLEQEDGGA